ncbi:hypothetical protein [Embleya sp. NPDC050493]|uniref:hypothetical protein n=1 Tax=Embleya sp. NPDC050493 TaxID=3363989 RepID=UPI003789FDD5
MGQAEGGAGVAGGPALIGEGARGVAGGVTYGLLGVGEGEAGLHEGVEGVGGRRVCGEEANGVGRRFRSPATENAASSVSPHVGPWACAVRPSGRPVMVAVHCLPVQVAVAVAV